MKLHLCSGARIEPGWINIDQDPPADIRHDVRAGLPYESETFTHIYSEHAIEHFDQDQGLRLLRECWRVLAPGCWLRLSTPDLRYLVGTYQAAARRLDRRLWTSAEMHTAEAHGLNKVAEQGYEALGAYKAVGFVPGSPAQLVNDGMRRWGHLYLYDELELELALMVAGFSIVRRVDHGVTTIPEMIAEGRPDCSELIMEARR